MVIPASGRPGRDACGRPSPDHSDSAITATLTTAAAPTSRNDARRRPRRLGDRWLGCGGGGHVGSDGREARRTMSVATTASASAPMPNADHAGQPVAARDRSRTERRRAAPGQRRSGSTPRSGDRRRTPRDRPRRTRHLAGPAATYAGPSRHRPRRRRCSPPHQPTRPRSPAARSRRRGSAAVPENSSSTARGDTSTDSPSAGDADTRSSCAAATPAAASQPATASAAKHAIRRDLIGVNSP